MDVLKRNLAVILCFASLLGTSVYAADINLPTVISGSNARSTVVFRYPVSGLSSITLNFTRLACDGGCIGPDDFDFRFYASDYESVAGFLLTDGSTVPGASGEVAFRTGVFSSDITVAEGPDQDRQGALNFPSIGENFSVTINIQSSSIATIGRTGSFYFAPTEFVVVADNDTGEKVRLNSISVISLDTDSDGITDAKELEIGTDPNTPNSNQDFATAFWQLVGSSIKKVAVMPVGLLTGLGALIALIALRRRP